MEEEQLHPTPATDVLAAGLTLLEAVSSDMGVLEDDVRQTKEGTFTWSAVSAWILGWVSFLCAGGRLVVAVNLRVLGRPCLPRM
jgi:hypothetical protein